MSKAQTLAVKPPDMWYIRGIGCLDNTDRNIRVIENCVPVTDSRVAQVSDVDAMYEIEEDAGNNTILIVEAGRVHVSEDAFPPEWSYIGDL